MAAAGAAEELWKCGQRTALQPTQELLQCHNPRAAQQSIVAFLCFLKEGIHFFAAKASQ